MNEKNNIKDLEIYTWTASEFLQRLAEAMDSSRTGDISICTENGCETPIRRGVRCEDCRKKRHAAAEAARISRKKLDAA